MFGFDGEYRRRPIQSLGGASQTCDRETVIKKAQQERQRRNEMRIRNNSAIVLQSYTRSFICRQRQKNNERRNFDEFMQTHRNDINADDALAYLLPRLIFFYNLVEAKDAERLIELCQHILKNYQRLLSHAVAEYIWVHRVQRLLEICIKQLKLTQVSQAIPLRMLETFTAKASVASVVENEELVGKYFQQIFQYLIRHGFFQRLKELLEVKCPPLDGEILHAPSAFTKALLQLILRPLTNDTQELKAYESFAQQILAPEHTEAIRLFLIPCIAESEQFCFEKLIDALDRLQNSVQLLEPTAANMEVDNETSVQQNQPTLQERTLTKTQTFSSFLLYSLFRLDGKHLTTLHSNNLLRVYIKLIAELSAKFLQVPRSALKGRESYRIHKRTQLEHDTTDDEDDDEEVHKRDGKDSKSAVLSELEKKVLLDCIDMLNESQRVQILLNHIKAYINDAEVLFSLCEICHNLMIFNKSAIYEYKLLYTMAFIPEVIHAIWFNLANESTKQGFSAPLLLISKGVEPRTNGVERTIAMVATFCMLFGRLLPTLHDVEFIDNDSSTLLSTSTSTTHVRLMPFSLAEIKQLSKTLKEISMGLVELAFPETRTSLTEHYRDVLGRSESSDLQLKQQKQIWANLLKVVVFVLNQLHTRDLRLGFCPESHWTVATLDLPLDRPADLPLTRGSRTRGIRPFQPIRDFTREDVEDGPPMSTKQIRSITILREIPFVVPFQKRVSVLQGLIAADKMRVQGHLQAFLQGPSVMLTVRRSHLYEDAFDKLRPENEPDLRLKFRVQFVSVLGLDEAGIDGGGVFREFLSELLKTAFDPNRGFFMVTTDNKLYPNPNAHDIVADFEKHYYFIGRILAKAIYENLLVELPLAEFFLTKLAGKYADVDIHQLASLDPELYKNLLYLKDYEGDVSDLNLDFTVASNSLGQTQIVELKPNGQSIAVNNSNRIEYLQLMADYKLNVQIRKHCKAFRRGLSNVLPVEWLYMFSNKELQVLISGAEIPIDLEDLKKHCNYGGEYSAEHPTIIIFWKVFETFNDSQRRQLLKFVTSCSRAPLLGFKNLDPPFFIQNAGDTERLPTASTCTNLLKLPPLRTEEQMREKLLYAISAAVGFELS